LKGNLGNGDTIKQIDETLDEVKKLTPETPEERGVVNGFIEEVEREKAQLTN
jgi:hypothetical protein